MTYKPITTVLSLVYSLDTHLRSLVLRQLLLIVLLQLLLPHGLLLLHPLLLEHLKSERLLLNLLLLEHVHGRLLLHLVLLLLLALHVLLKQQHLMTLLLHILVVLQHHQRRRWHWLEASGIGHYHQLLSLWLLGQRPRAAQWQRLERRHHSRWRLRCLPKLIAVLYLNGDFIVMISILKRVWLSIIMAEWFIVWSNTMFGRPSAFLACTLRLLFCSTLPMDSGKPSSSPTVNPEIYIARWYESLWNYWEMS